MDSQHHNVTAEAPHVQVVSFRHPTYPFQFIVDCGRVQVHGDAYRWISVEGVIERRETGPGAEEHIDQLSRAYDGEPWTPTPGQERVRWHVRPTRIVRYGG